MNNNFRSSAMTRGASTAFRHCICAAPSDCVITNVPNHPKACVKQDIQQTAPLFDIDGTAKLILDHPGFGAQVDFNCICTASKRAK